MNCFRYWKIELNQNWYSFFYTILFILFKFCHFEPFGNSIGQNWNLKIKMILKSVCLFLFESNLKAIFKSKFKSLDKVWRILWVTKWSWTQKEFIIFELSNFILIKNFRNSITTLFWEFSTFLCLFVLKKK